MKLKQRCLALLFCGAAALAGAAPCLAQEATVRYRGGEMVTEGALGFAPLIPGESRSATVMLVNESDHPAAFSLDTATQNLLRQQCTAGYRASLRCGGEELYLMEPLTLGGELAGVEGTVPAGGLSGLENAPAFAAVLEPGESTELVFTLQPDGRSMDNRYMGQQGWVQFGFEASRLPGPVTEYREHIIEQKGEPVIIRLRRAVQTGDSQLLWLAAAGLLAGTGGAAAVRYAAGKRKGE